MAAATNALPEVGLVQPARRRRQFIDENATPLGALVWRTARQKAKLFDQWRVAIGKLFPSSARVLRVAWALEWLFGQEGFAYATDSYLSRKLGIPVNKIQAALQDLERAGGIIRASVFVQNKPQRRIWPSSQIVQRSPPSVGGRDTPHQDAQTTPRAGETEYLGKHSSFQKPRISSTAQAARREAESRDARARLRENQQ